MAGKADLLNRQVTSAKHAGILNSASANDARYASIPLDAITPRADNRKLDQVHLARLIEDIEMNSLLQDVLVRPVGDAYEMVCGHHRLEAYKALREKNPKDLKYKTIPAKIVKMDDDMAAARALASNLFSPDSRLTPVERAQAYEQIDPYIDNMRSQDPSLKGVKTNKIISDIVMEGSVSERTVARDRSLLKEKRKEDERVAKMADALSLPRDVRSGIASLPDVEKARIIESWEGGAGKDDVCRSYYETSDVGFSKKAHRCERDMIPVVDFLRIVRGSERAEEADDLIDTFISVLKKLKSGADDVPGR